MNKIKTWIDEDRICYSKNILGNWRNYKWSVRFDITTDGFLGITQFDGPILKDRVLMTPAQVQKLLKFLEHKSQEK
jgi:hypothetical protein